MSANARVLTRAQASPLILSLGLAGFVVMADNWVVSPILPAIASDVGVTPVRAAVLIAAYMLSFALFQLVFGPLADRYGKLAVLRVAMVGFTVATGLTALGSTVTDLTVFRALTGAFAAAAMPISLALLGAGFMFAHSTLLTIATKFAARALGSAMSPVAFCMMGGGAIGTSIGQRFIEGTSFTTFFGVWGVLLVALAAIALVAVADIPRATARESRVPATAVSSSEVGGGAG